MPRQVFEKITYEHDSRIEKQLVSDLIGSRGCQCFKSDCGCDNTVYWSEKYWTYRIKFPKRKRETSTLEEAIDMCLKHDLDQARQRYLSACAKQWAYNMDHGEFFEIASKMHGLSKHVKKKIKKSNFDEITDSEILQIHRKYLKKRNEFGKKRTEI
jgi:hypothetical protein